MPILKFSVLRSNCSGINCEVSDADSHNTKVLPEGNDPEPGRGIEATGESTFLNISISVRSIRSPINTSKDDLDHNSGFSMFHASKDRGLAKSSFGSEFFGESSTGYPPQRDYNNENR
jgi:hypothetical protein